MHGPRTSFSGDVLEVFTDVLSEAGHTYEVGDLYRMNFRSELSREEYLREIRQEAGAPLQGCDGGA
ncbi:hypothetical protein [Methanothermobacter sp.]|uniref:hypothetical protein n=1 Tax=Methanothermobacter sp. TaxID=1884223 RepID=UPI003C74E40D